MLKAAHAHKGASFVEIYQNCIVYNDDVFASFTEKKNAADNQIWLEHGKPMLFAGGTKGLSLDRADLKLHVVEVVDGDWQAADVIVHDQTNHGIAQMLIDLGPGRRHAGGARRDLQPSAPDLRPRRDRAECGGGGGKEARSPGVDLQGPDLDGREGAARHMIAIAVALAAAAPAAQLAQATPPPPPAPAAARPRARRRGDEGARHVRRGHRRAAPAERARSRCARACREAQAMRGQLAAAAAATPFDVDAFAELLRQSSLLESSARARSEERIVTTLKALPAADRSIFAKAVFGGAPPAPPAPPPPRP